jgi:hypothetical protein
LSINASNISKWSTIGFDIVFKDASGKAYSETRFTDNSSTITSNGTYTFKQKFETGATYAITTKKTYFAETWICTLQGNGTIQSKNLTLDMSCPATRYMIGGKIINLTGNGLNVNSGSGGYIYNGGATSWYTLASTYADKASYNVTISTQPSGQTCTVANASGTINGDGVDNINITCAP